MSQTISLPDRYVRALTPLGDLKEAVSKALQRYVVEQITSKITELQAQDRAWAEKYSCDYETFVARTAEDEAFVEHIERDVCKTWELDLAEWEFCHKGIKDWIQHLQEDFAELIAYIQANFQRVRIERVDHTPERSILGVTCYWGKYALRITEIVSTTARKYRYYVFDGEYIVAGFDNAADTRVLRMKYGRCYKRYLGRFIPHLHLDDKSRLELTDEMTVEALVAWLCDHLPLSV